MPEKMSDVIVVLPGIMGSVLQKNGKDVWSSSFRAIAGGIFSRGGKLQDLELAHDDVEDGVEATRLMPDVHLIPGFWKIDGYSTIRTKLHEQFDLKEGENYFEFPYDWRRDNRASARDLEKKSQNWLKNWRAKSGNNDAQLILVGHSMGGLVSRYFLEALDGWRNTRALITFGTPYRGSINALDTLVNGVRKGPRGFIDLTDAVRSFPSVYQLLPIYPAYDPGDGQLVRVGETNGIPNLNAQKAAAALAFHREIMDLVDDHLDDDEYRANRYRIAPIVGTLQPTNQSARRAGDGVKFLRTYQGRDLHGDGTVPRVSATPVELSNDNQEMFCATKHASLQNASPALTHLAGVTGDLYLDLGRFRAPRLTNPKVGLDVEDAYWTDEPITIHALPDRPGLELHVTIADASSGQTVVSEPFHLAQEGEQEATIAPLPAGVYRATISGEGNVERAEDIFAVFDENDVSGQ
jgi:pimeloyl-ACP methyl ester carboxylesterase